MIRSLLLLCGIGFVLTPSGLWAEEQVTLKSGTRIVGNISFTGQTVTITIGDTQITVPTSEIELIGPVGSNFQQTPERLLMIALESRLQLGSGEGQVGLLAEAHRQAPDDPRIAYWYAQSLLDAGFGSAAQMILQTNRAAIGSAFPGMTDRLAKRIQDRISFENLPAKLIARIDQLELAAHAAPRSTNRVPVYVRFRLVDQHERPIESSAFHIQSNGNDEYLETFEEGHFLLTFISRGNESTNDCQLDLNWPGLESRQITLHPVADQVADAGEFIINRFSDNAKVSYVVMVVDQQGTPIKGATLTLRPVTRKNDRTDSLTAETDAQGRAEINAFPMNYSYSVSAKGFNSEGGSVELNADTAKREAQRIEIYPMLSATIRVVWIAKSSQGEETATTGETALRVGVGTQPTMPYGHGPDSVTFLRPMQVKDRLTLQSGPPFFAGPMMAGMTFWVRRAPDELVKGSPLEFFTGVDLKKLDELQDKLVLPEIERSPGPGQYAPIAFPVKQGEVYLGELPNRDVRTGQPTLASFKVYIEEISHPAPQQ